MSLFSHVHLSLQNHTKPLLALDNFLIAFKFDPDRLNVHAALMWDQLKNWPRKKIANFIHFFCANDAYIIIKSHTQLKSFYKQHAKKWNRTMFYMSGTHTHHNTILRNRTHDTVKILRTHQHIFKNLYIYK